MSSKQPRVLFSLLAFSDIEGKMKGEISCLDFQEHLHSWNLEGQLPQRFKARWNILKKMERDGKSKQKTKAFLHMFTQKFTQETKKMKKIMGSFGKLCTVTPLK